MLVTSIFSFSHNVLKRLLSQTRQKVSLCGNGLTIRLLFSIWGLSGKYLRYPEIEEKDSSFFFFFYDGVHLSEKGNMLFLGNIWLGLKKFTSGKGNVFSRQWCVRPRFLNFWWRLASPWVGEYLHQNSAVTVYDSYRQFTTVTGSLRQLQAVYDSYRPLMKVTGSFKSNKTLQFGSLSPALDCLISFWKLWPDSANKLLTVSVCFMQVWYLNFLEFIQNERVMLNLNHFLNLSTVSVF